MIDPRQLRALAAVATEGSVARAAKHLGWSQPTVDYHLRALDRVANTALTVRSSRGSTLTPAGNLMLERGEEILSLSERAVADVREFAKAGSARLRFGSFPTAAAHLLPGIVSRLSEIDIELDVTLEEIAPLVARINQHTIDAALVYTATGYSLPFRTEVHTTRVLTDPLLLALPQTHAQASRESFETEDLLRLEHDSWVFGATPGDTLDAAVVDVFAGAGRRFEVAIRTDDYAVALGMVAAGMGVALVPRLATVSVPDGAVLRPISDPRFSREILLAAPGTPGGPPQAVRQLAEAVRQAVSALG